VLKYKIGLCQFRPELLNKTSNIQKMVNMVKGINADLIVFPELATSGYAFTSKAEVFSVADAFESSQTTDIFSELAKVNNTTYVLGFPELSDDELYNSAMLVNPDGSKHIYRKVHLFNEEKLWFHPGDLGLNVVIAKNGVNVGMMICFDWIFPEAARTLMLKGASILVHCANLVLPWCQQAMVTRSLENRVFSVTCNRIGQEVNGEKDFYFTGTSQTISPKGEILCRLNETEETVKIVEIETDEANDKNITPYNNLLLDRRREWYELGVRNEG